MSKVQEPAEVLLAGGFLIAFFSTIISVVLIPLWILNGWVFMTLWGWFAVPLGAPSITLAHGLGIACLVHFLVHTSKAPEPKINDEYVTKPTTTQQVVFIIGCYLKPLFALLVGWILHRYFM